MANPVCSESNGESSLSDIAESQLGWTKSTPKGQRLESHTKTLMERASSRNQLSPLPKIGEGFGEWSEALSYGKRGLGEMRGRGLALRRNSWPIQARRAKGNRGKSPKRAWPQRVIFSKNPLKGPGPRGRMQSISSNFMLTFDKICVCVGTHRLREEKKEEKVWANQKNAVPLQTLS